MTSQPFNATSYATLSGSRQSAEVVAPIVLDLLGKPTSVVDFGCGIGAWLAGFQSALGVGDLVGLEGGHPEPGQLQVGPDVVLQRDLQQPVDLGRRFDLAVSVEVAEHIPGEQAGTFIESIARHSDAVVFSAAIPGQGGIDHINEQWPAYWYELWTAQGFECFDVLRWVVWNDRRVDAWFRQNLLLYVRGDAAETIRAAGHVGGEPRAVVHPALLERYQAHLHRVGDHRPRSLRGIARQAASFAKHRNDPTPAPPTTDWPL